MIPRQALGSRLCGPTPQAGPSQASCPPAGVGSSCTPAPPAVGGGEVRACTARAPCAELGSASGHRGQWAGQAGQARSISRSQIKLGKQIIPGCAPVGPSCKPRGAPGLPARELNSLSTRGKQAPVKGRFQNSRGAHASSAAGQLAIFRQLQFKSTKAISLCHLTAERDSYAGSLPTSTASYLQSSPGSSCSARAHLQGTATPAPDTGG